MILPLANRARQGHAGRAGASRTSSAASAGDPRGCGCPRRRSTWRRSRSWRSRASGSRSSRRTRRAASGRSARRAGRSVAAAGDRPDAGLPRARCRPGRAIALFFYDGPISHGPSPSSGLLAKRARASPGACSSAFSTDATGPQLVHIATDGETYGHHHRHGDMALAYALRTHREPTGIARLTNYGEYPGEAPADARGARSSRTPPGAARTASSAGAATAAATPAAHPGWNQAWRAPLREALDWLARRRSRPASRQRAGELLQDPWAARDDYIDVILDRSPESVDALPRAPRRAGARRAEERHARSEAAGDAAPRAAHVHELRLVLRRRLGDRDRARSSSTPGAPCSSRRSSSGADLEAPFLDALGAGEEQRPRGPRRPAHLRGVRAAGHGLARAGRRALRGPLALRRVRRSGPCLRLPRRARGRPAPRRAGERGLRSAGCPRHLRDHRRVRPGRRSACCTSATTTSPAESRRSRRPYTRLVAEISEPFRRRT